MHDSIHMIIWKGGNYWDENQISGCQILGKVDYKIAMQGIFIVTEMFNMLLWFEYMTMHLSKSTEFLHHTEWNLLLKSTFTKILGESQDGMHTVTNKTDYVVNWWYNLTDGVDKKETDFLLESMAKYQNNCTWKSLYPS